MGLPLLVISPFSRDFRELTKRESLHPMIYDSYSSVGIEKYVYEEGSENAERDNILQTIQQLIDKYRHVALGGIVTSDDYPGSIVAAVLAQELGLPGPKPKSVLCCQHKYYSRVAQQQAVPSAVPAFQLVDPKTISDTTFTLSFPCFMKPIKSYFSCFATIIHSHDELVAIAHQSLPHPAFFEPINDLLKKYSDFELPANYLIAEELLSGMQGTIEGYVYQGNFGFMGIVDSVMYPGTISFERFVYPSALSSDVQKRMEAIAESCMRHIGFDNGLFNIEFFYNPDKDNLHIIEINPRMAAQFADLYEKVDGINTYDVGIAIATGKKPTAHKGKGKYKIAASCVLRKFENMTATKIPTFLQIEDLKSCFPDTIVEVLVQEGHRLSEEIQDGKSYRYGVIQLGADSKNDLETKLQECEKFLDFQFTSK